MLWYALYRFNLLLLSDKGRYYVLLIYFKV